MIETKILKLNGINNNLEPNITKQRQFIQLIIAFFLEYFVFLFYVFLCF